MKYDYDYVKVSADYIRNIVNFEPEIGIILGSGLGKFAQSIENPVVIPYEDIPNFLVSTVDFHAGKLIFGQSGGRNIVCMSGRFHYYEGYDFEQLVLPIRLFKLLGVKKTILTNAAGAVNTEYNVGDIMIIKDHLKLTGASPLCGKNDEHFGPRFFDTTDMYSKELREIALECAQDSDLTFREGVYMFFTGPQFETPAEIRAARILGADAVGMSTVTEALTAAHCGMKLLALSVMTNMAAGVLPQKLSDDEVRTVAAKISDGFVAYVQKLISKI